MTELFPFEERAQRAPHVLLGVIVAFFVLATLWASIATLDEVTRGEGKVVTSSQIQVVQNMEGGIVSEILVKEGQLVEKDRRASEPCGSNELARGTPPPFIGQTLKFDAQGKLVDETTRKFRRDLLAGFKLWIERIKPRK